jgi:hypothetical protein
VELARQAVDLAVETGEGTRTCFHGETRFRI